MKKLIILAGILLLPFLASAYQLDEDFADMANKISSEVTQGVDNADAENQENTRKDKIKRVKKIILLAVKDLSGSWGVSGGTSGASGSISFSKYYDTEEIAKALKDENLDTFLANDAEALEEAADYTTEHFFLYKAYNDFETLLTIGVNPIEAAVRSDHPDYLQSALENGEITYQHYTTTVHSTYMGGSIVAHTEDITIPATTNEEEINALKEKFKKKTFWEKTESVLRKVDHAFQKADEVMENMVEEFNLGLPDFQ